MKELTRRRRFDARRVIGGRRAVSGVSVLVMQAPGGGTSLKVLAGGPEDPKRVAPVQGARGGERGAATLVRPAVEDLVVRIAWKGRSCY